MAFLDNTRRPEGLGGKLMIWMMNLGHRALSRWGLSFLPLRADAQVLDCGCGGGAAVQALLRKCPQGMVRGIDYSDLSVETARARNQKAIQTGRCEVLRASVTDLPFAAAQFDCVTAFETVYFWPELQKSFGQVFRVLKPGGTFLLCNACGGERKADAAWPERIDGMTIYTGSQLQTLLEQAGFERVQTHKHGNGWLCLTARRPLLET